MKGGVYDSPNEDEKLQSYVLFESVFLPFHSWTVPSACWLWLSCMRQISLLWLAPFPPENDKVNGGALQVKLPKF